MDIFIIEKSISVNNSASELYFFLNFNSNMKVKFVSKQLIRGMESRVYISDERVQRFLFSSLENIDSSVKKNTRY